MSVQPTEFGKTAVLAARGRLWSLLPEAARADLQAHYRPRVSPPEIPPRSLVSLPVSDLGSSGAIQKPWAWLLLCCHRHSPPFILLHAVGA